MKPMITMNKVCKVYRRGAEQVRVLQDLDLEIASGEFLALMGPSGSGKTTLLNLLGGLDSPNSGEIVIEGKRMEQMGVSQLSAWRSRNVGFIFQFYNLMPTLTAQRNVALPLLLTPLGRTERKRRAEVSLSLVGLAGRMQHRPGELSGGQQQRVAIARAIVTDPTILICDEPTGDLDRESAAEVMSLLQQLNRMHGKTIIMVTHDPKAASYASRTVLLDKGSLVSSSTVAAPI